MAKSKEPNQNYKLYFKVVDNTTASPVVGIQTEPEVIGG